MRFALLAAACLFAGCFTLRVDEGKAAAPVPLKTALADMELNLSRVHLFVLSDAQRMKTDPQAVARLLAVIADVQCFDIDPVTHKPNPALRTRNALLPLVTGPVQLQVQGQISESGTFTVSAAPSAGGTLTRGAQQQVAVPISLVSLANLSNYYIGLQTTSLQYLTLVSLVQEDDPRQKADKQQASAAVSATLEVAGNLSKLTEEAFRRFDGVQAGKDDQYCKGRDGGDGPPVVLGTGAII